MRIGAIVQARTGSTRLPYKVLIDVCGKTILAHVLQRIQQCRLVDEIVVATSDVKADDAIVHECNKHKGISIYRGSEEDVLDRYYCAAAAFNIDTVVRITSDCPLIDPYMVDQVIGYFLLEGTDYACNSLERTFPRGLDTEVFSAHVLKQAWKNSSEPYQRANVTPYIYLNPRTFSLLSLFNIDDYSSYRWTVDTLEDLHFIQEIYSRFIREELFRWTDIVNLIDEEPYLKNINKHIIQKDLLVG